MTLWQPGIAPNPGGFTKLQRRRIVSLALTVRSLVDPEEVVQWLYTVWKTGRDPLAADMQGSEAIVDIKVRKDCLELLLNRGWGMPAQHLIVDADVRAAAQADLPPVDVPQSLDAIRARRAALRNAGVKPRVIETTAFERHEIPQEAVLDVDSTEEQDK